MKLPNQVNPIIRATTGSVHTIRANNTAVHPSAIRVTFTEICRVICDSPFSDECFISCTPWIVWQTDDG